MTSNLLGGEQDVVVVARLNDDENEWLSAIVGPRSHVGPRCRRLKDLKCGRACSRLAK